MKDPTSGIARLKAENEALRKRMAELEAEARLHTPLEYVLNGIDAPIYVADLETHEMLFVNKAGSEIWGGDLIGKPCYEALQGLNAPCGFCTNEKLLTPDGEPSGVIQWEIQYKGNGKWYDLRDRAIRWTDGRMARIEVALDITDRKETELKLQREKEKFDKIVLTAPGAICMFRRSPSGVFSFPYADPDIEDVYGFTPDQLREDAGVVEKCMPAGERDRLREEIAASAAQEKPLFTEHEYNHPSRGKVWLELRFVPEREQDNGVTWYGYILDITSEKRHDLRARVLIDIAGSAMASGDVREFSMQVMQSLGKCMDIDSFYIALYDEKTGMFSLPFERGEKDKIETWPVAKSASGLVLKQRKSLLLKKSDILQLIKDGTIKQVGRMCEAWLGAPLISDDQVTGVIVVQDYNNPHAFSREDQAMLEFVSNHISLALQRQKALDDLRFQSLILNQIKDRVTVTDLEGTITYVNRAEGEMLNVPPESLIGKTVYDYGENPEKGATQDEVISETLQRGEWRGEVVNYSSDGREIILDVRTSVVKNQEGKAIGLCGVSTDITDRKKDMEQLDYHLRFQRMVADISSSFVRVTSAAFDDTVNQMLARIGRFFGVDRTYLFKFSNDYETMDNTHEWCEKDIEPQIERLKGFPVSALPWWKTQIRTKPSVHIPDIDALPAEALHEQEELRKQGIKSLLTVPVYQHNRVVGFFGFDSVRTKKTWSEVQIESLKIMANIIADALNKMEVEASLVSAKNKAEESSRLKSAFLANVSHEIRTPMNAICGFLELLKEPDLEGGQRDEYIDIVHKSGQRLMQTINDIIEVSKLEAGQVYVNLEDVYVPNVLEYIHQLFSHKAMEKGLTYRLKDGLSPETTGIITDRHKLEGILANLVSNAVKFTHTGHIELGSYLEENNVVFYVEDTGEGIPEEKHQSVFNRFVQADQELSRGYEGSGLGLAIAKAYVFMLGGTIWVRSEPDKGSTFFVSLPYRPATTPSPIAPPAVKPKSSGRLKNCTILVAEDDLSSYRFLDTVLKKEGAKPIRVDNGADAVSAVRENPRFCLVLMDWKMPEMSGLTATREIRKFNKTIPIIIQTAHALEGDREKTRNAGCSDYIAKPIKADKLVALIRQYVGG